LILFTMFTAVVGCGSSTPSGPVYKFDEKKIVSEALKKIADDKSVSDDETFNRYLKRYPYKPMIWPKNAPPWTHTEPAKGGGYTLLVRAYRQLYAPQDKSKHDPLLEERQFVKRIAEFNAQFLGDLQDRGLKSITYIAYGSVKESAEAASGYEDLFKVVVTPANLAKLREHLGDEPTAGSVFDPRHPKIDTLWKVETNIFPKLEYKLRN
jgi:hypothetical protein